MNKLTGEQIEAAIDNIGFYPDYVNSEKLADELNKLLENEAVFSSLLEHRIFDIVSWIKSSQEITHDKLNKIQDGIMTHETRYLELLCKYFELIEDRIDKIQEQLTSLSGENKKEMSDNEVWEMLKKSNEASKNWPHLGQDFNKCEGCPFYNKPILSIINPCEKCQGWVWRQQNTPQTYVTTTTMPLQNHTAQINIEMGNLTTPPQKETQEKSCENCKHGKKSWRGDIYPTCGKVEHCVPKNNWQHWQPKDNQESR